MVFGLTVITTSRNQETLRRKGNGSLLVSSSVAGLLWTTGSPVCDLALTTPTVWSHATSLLFLLASGCCSSKECEPCSVAWRCRPLFLLHLVAAEDKDSSYPELEFTNFLQGAKKLEEGNQATAQIAWTF